MKLLHTSDWHLGRALYGCKRYDEYEAFLNWLAAFIDSEESERPILMATFGGWN